MDLARFAVRMIWGSYLFLSVLAAMFLLLLEPKRLDIVGLTLALILMGVGSAVIAVALLAGSIVATRAIVYESSTRRASVVFTMLAGWIGTLLLGWLAWSSWTE